ncbi:glycosyltransferase family 2 protein [Xinfangfangia sp. CPCC 101601]|uniref:Glycosyltransferase family 2 protein n=1 Tax=Pseudogemmobacter lacusdianii TaxID=3069608 RepID=A0ABU0VXV4_9RHOB|nr:glycosyltransferase family 2 protein [Xinfangfangia sp. CPCC 101601]MDQ2066592.1 glycosyltransferase family 2 protein [Xinfangfangia sp. CPCC 101601]
MAKIAPSLSREGLGLAPSRHGTVTAVSMMKDEGPFLLEWVAHHLTVGFNRLVVYTNDCSDGTDTMLIRLEELGLAYHRRNVIPEGLRPQPSALNHAQDEPLVAESDWVLVFDADEFLCIRYGDGTLNDLLDGVKAQGANGMVITWRIFGSGGVHDWSRAPVTEQYLRAAPKEWNKGWGVKTLFQFDPAHWKLGIHRPKIKNKWLESDFPDSIKWLNGSGRAMEDYFKFRGWRSITRTVGYDWAQINHYAVKSIDSYAIRKFRGNVNLKKDKYNADYWALQDRNEVQDDAMLRYSAERKRVFDLLLSDPELNRLHHAALDRAEARLAEFKGLPAYDEMVAGLKAASQVPIDAVVAKPPQARDPEKIAALMSRVEKQSNETERVARKALGPQRGTGLAEPAAQGLASGVEWVANHEIALPLDPGHFSPSGLEQIAAGKFDRGVARILPRLLQGAARHLELGAGCGFRAAVLARARPVLQQIQQESDPGRVKLIRAIWERNGLEKQNNLTLRAGALDQEALQELIETFRPDSLLIADPALDPQILMQALRSGAPALRLILAGPAMAESQRWQAIFPALAAARPDETQPEFLLAQLARAD